MCIISVIPQGAQAPTKDRLEYMFYCNPDGGGYMYSDGTNVIIKKGYLTFDSFYKNFSRDFKRYGGYTPFVTHFRITTHGANDATMTHPFPITDSVKKLRKTYTTCKIGVAHNGIISLTSDAKQISDTAKFIKRYGFLFEDDRALDIIEASISNSRMAVLYSDKTYALLGKWCEENGVYYSNSDYKPYKKYKAPKVSKGKSYTPYAWDYASDYYNDEYDYYNNGADYWDSIEVLAQYGLTIDENGKLSEL